MPLPSYIIKKTPTPSFSAMKSLIKEYHFWLNNVNDIEFDECDYDIVFGVFLSQWKHAMKYNIEY